MSKKTCIFVLLFGKEDICPIFKFENDLTNFSNIITDFILNDEGLVALGGLKMYSDEDNKHMIQFYIGDKHFALFPANDFVIKG